MAKGQVRGNKEARKPKSDKKPAPAPTTMKGFAPSQSPAKKK
jgi:hypothetical protein